VATGAAEFTVKQLGNSGCRRWTIEGGVGQVRLDLGGDWVESAQVRVRMTVGAVILEAPRDLGIRIELDRFLAGFESAGFSREGKLYVSDNFRTARRTVDLTVETTLGNVKVEWR
jgi:predicted membrane protein